MAISLSCRSNAAAPADGAARELSCRPALFDCPCTRVKSIRSHFQQYKPFEAGLGSDTGGCREPDDNVLAKICCKVFGTRGMAFGVSPESSDVQGPPFRQSVILLCVRWCNPRWGWDVFPRFFFSERALFGLGRTLPILASALGFLLDAARFRARFRLAAAVARLIPAAALHRADCASARHQQSRLSLSDYRCGRAVYLCPRDLLIELVPKRYAHVARRPAGGRAGDEIRGPLTARWPRLISNVLDGRAMRRCRSEPCSLQGARVEDLTKNRRRLAFLRSLHRRGWFDPTLTCVIGGLGYEPVPDRTVSDNDGYLSAHWGMGSGKSAATTCQNITNPTPARKRDWSSA
ncbi:hypothetical protein BQ8482_220118 [Mesorhizobium delmotii]|uniref:Uncharacterized protein n=1 Tax=Mesorhizobium delmotii TaxID=1631247 RepID=A0A2P9ALF4_9HYPH|nr:hypothetical protein BQ8482_220118 [Mesorhizobium delmotii]